MTPGLDAEMLQLSAVELAIMIYQWASKAASGQIFKHVRYEKL